MIEVSPAKPEDAPALPRILQDAVRYKRRHDDPSWNPGFSERGVHWLINSGTTYLVSVDGEPAATFALVWDDAQDREAWQGFDVSDAGYLHRMAVSDRFRGRQLGRQIVNWATNEVCEHGKRHLRLDCSEDNTGLGAYYKRLGFSKAGTHHFEATDVFPAYTAALYQRLAGHAAD